jgi:hypothetical protein
MKKLLVTLMLLVFWKFSFSQDVISKRNGEDIEVKIIEVGITEVRYKKFDNLDGPIFVIEKAQIIRISYENGTKDEFSGGITPPPTSNSSYTEEDLRIRGQKDAVKHYDNYRSSGTGS